MQIHRVEAIDELRHEVDPIRGVVVRKQQVLKQGTAHTISDSEGNAYEAAEDGTFSVPDELGDYLVTLPGWYEGPNPLTPTVTEVVEPVKRGAKASV